MSGTGLSPRSVDGRRIMVFAGKAFLCSARSLSELPPTPRNDLTHVHDRYVSSHHNGDAQRAIGCQTLVNALVPAEGLKVSPVLSMVV